MTNPQHSHQRIFCRHGYGQEPDANRLPLWGTPARTGRCRPRVRPALLGFPHVLCCGQSRARSLPRRPLPRPRTAGGPRPGPGRRDGGCKFGTAAGSRTAATKLAVLVAQRSPRHCRTAEPQNRRITVLSPVWGRAWQNSPQNSRRGVWRT